MDPGIQEFVKGGGFTMHVIVSAVFTYIHHTPIYIHVLLCSDLEAAGGRGGQGVTPFFQEIQTSLIQDVKLPEIGHGPPPRQTRFSLVPPPPPLPLEKIMEPQYIARIL